MLMPSHYARNTAPLDDLVRELEVDCVDGRDPLTLVRDISVGIHGAFDYVRKSTGVNSPIEASLTSRQGVCQDFAHIMIAVVRGQRIPCRYVSGYLYHGDEHHDRSSTAPPTRGWRRCARPVAGSGSTDQNLMTGPRHIRTAVGRDYADVPHPGHHERTRGDRAQVRVG